MSKTEADYLKKIEIWWLLRDMKNRSVKHTTISWGTNGDRGSIGCEVNLWDENPYVRFHYNQTDNYSGEKKDFDYKVPLITTPCKYGGSRYWFKCPLYKSGVYCGKRVGVLYKDGDWFGCRHCYELTYSSRKVNKNYKYYPLFHIIELETKIERLHMKTKRKTWRGRPTKNQRKLDALYRQSMTDFRLYEQFEKDNPKG